MNISATGDILSIFLRLNGVYILWEKQKSSDFVIASRADAILVKISPVK